MENTSQQVRCLTVSKEQLMVYLPPTLPHDKAVYIVEHILEVNFQFLILIIDYSARMWK